ncbi:hypothetical protein SELMODRAFT_414283 [Selaginella moellendorffii]|uniref:PARP catalytic domain-containing protein n=1 Tax=Selaginella moellendorffii TaxID=88036 RepID=D8RS90_SELML|nr:hypothetical protein SELMODRAFT_414283 [Selaginella moellendorffii]
MGTVPELLSSNNHTYKLNSSKLTTSCGAKFRDHQQLHQHQRSSVTHYEVESMRKDDPERGRVIAYFHAKWNHPGSEASGEAVRGLQRKADGPERQQGRKECKGGPALPRHDGLVRASPQQQSTSQPASPLQQSLCSNLSCSLCNIILAAFKKKKAKVDGFLRFGPGIYVTATSSKANYYVKASSGSRPHAILVCKVLAGMVFKVTEDRPSYGYHSVSCEIGYDDENEHESNPTGRVNLKEVLWIDQIVGNVLRKLNMALEYLQPAFGSVIVDVGRYKYM